MNLRFCLLFMLSFTQPPLLIVLFYCQSLMLLLNLRTSFSLSTRDETFGVSPSRFLLGDFLDGSSLTRSRNRLTSHP